MRIFSAILAACAASIDLRRFLDQRDDVAHAEDAVGEARGMEVLDRVHLLADAEELDRLAGDRAHRKRRAAAPVAVHARQHDAGEADALVELPGEIDRVLAGQRVGDEQHFVRVGGVADLDHLRHQRLVDMGAAGGVEQHDVVALEARGGFRAPRDVDRVLARNDRQRVDADLAGPSTASCSCAAGRFTSSEAISTLRLSRSARRLAILAAVVVLPAPCRPTSMIATGAGALRSIAWDSPPSVSISASWTILTTIWPGLTDLTTAAPTALRARAVDERAHDLERDVRLEQRAPHLAHRGVDVLLREGAAAGQFIQYAGELFGQALEHEMLLSGE